MCLGKLNIRMLNFENENSVYRSYLRCLGEASSNDAMCIQHGNTPTQFKGLKLEFFYSKSK
jgi:hypothetical protein